jgi:hypothetical protein
MAAGTALSPAPNEVVAPALPEFVSLIFFSEGPSSRCGWDEAAASSDQLRISTALPRSKRREFRLKYL